MPNRITQPVRGNLQPREHLRSSTIREFDGGLNIIDSDLNLDSRFSKVLQNMYRSPDGTQSIRYGTRLFSALSGDSKIINMRYFADRLICVRSDGTVVSVDGTGRAVTIWSETIANSLPDTPSGWSNVFTFCDFTTFRSDLIITNGVDKPLIVSPDLQCQYLFDLGTGTNINTPVTKYVTSVDEFTIMAGDMINPTLLHISNQRSSGTWFNDTAPNNATQYDIGPYVANGDDFVKGIIGFRNQLIVSLEEQIVIVRLGEFTDAGEHVPRVEDVIPQHGTVSNRAMQSLGDDLLFADNVGVPSLKRSVFTETLRPERVSELIDPEIQRRLQRLSTAALEDRVFSVYNRNEGQYMLFIPNNALEEDTNETICFAYMKIDSLKVEAWAEFRGWNWSSAARSAQGRIFFSQDNNIFIYGSRDDELHADLIGYAETWSDGTTWTDNTGWLVAVDDLTELDYQTGLPITFDWQQPWADFDNRSIVKHMRYIGIETTGTARFTFDTFVDNIFEDRSSIGLKFADNTSFDDGTGWKDEIPVYIPARSMDFLGGDNLGFGGHPFGQNYGAGRVTSDERLFSWPLRGKIFKIRVHGTTDKPLKFASIYVDYMQGSIRR